MSNFFDQFDPKPAPPPLRSASPLIQYRGRDVADTPLATAVRGFGQGVTAGLIQYPQAALKALVNDQTFKESLADLRRDNEQLAKTQPKAWYGGQVAGGGLAAVGSGGASLAALAGRGAALGATSGFTEKEDIKDAAIGAALGGVLGAAPLAARKLSAPVVEKYAGKKLADRIDSLRKKRDADSMEALEGIFGTTNRENIRAGGRNLREEAKDLASTLRSGELKPGEVDVLVRNPATIRTLTPTEYIEDIAKGAMYAAGSGAVGGLGAGMAGGNPIAGAMMGAAGGAALGGKFAALRGVRDMAENKMITGAVNNTLRQTGPVSETVTRGATMLATPGVVNAANPQVNFFDQFDAPPAPPLRRLANDFRSRMNQSEMPADMTNVAP